MLPGPLISFAAAALATCSATAVPFVLSRQPNGVALWKPAATRLSQADALGAAARAVQLAGHHCFRCGHGMVESQELSRDIHLDADTHRSRHVKILPMLWA